MADGILTQEEIDALLASYSKSQGTSKGDARSRSANAYRARRMTQPKRPKPKRKQLPMSERPMKVYDFRNPDKFSKEQLRTLQLVHETFGRSFGTTLSAQVRSPVRIEVDSCIQCSYDEFLAGLPTPTSIYIFTAKPLEGRMLLEINPGFSLAVVNRLLGGPWRSTAKLREPTEIEHGLMRTIVGRALQSMRVGWRSIAGITCELVGYESDPQFAQILAPNDTVCVISFSMHMGGFVQHMSLAIPYVALQPVIGRLNAQQWFMDPGRYAGRKTTRRVSLDEATLGMSVELGQATVTMRELLELEVGDVIRLDTKRDEPVLVSVGYLPKFLASPGTSGKRTAVQVVEILTEGIDEDE